MFGRIPFETIRSWAFVCLEYFNHSFNFSACDWSSHIFYFFLAQSWETAFLRICPFLPGCPFYWHTVAHHSLMILRISVRSFVTFYFSFLILLIWVPSLFNLSFAKGLSILFIFSKNHIFISLIFATAFFVYWIYFCSYL